MVVRLATVLAVVAVCCAFALWRRGHDGKARTVEAQDVVTAADLGEELGEHATLVQFSSEFCAPCRGARRVLQRVAATSSGVRHVELDVAAHVDLVTRFDVLRTPTVIILDGSGRVTGRITGVPTPGDVHTALGSLETEAGHAA